LEQSAINMFYAATLIVVVAFSTVPMLTVGAEPTVGAKSLPQSSSLSPAGIGPPTTAGSALALTPFGRVPRTCVQQVDAHGQLFSALGIADIILLSNGSQIRIPPCTESNQAVPSAESTPVIPDGQGNSSRTPCWWGFGCSSGWVEYATWCYCPRSPPAISEFDAYWRVPQPPSSHDGQTIFLFSALQTNGVSSYPLAQPVLQWGNAADGGGAYWTLNSWMLTSNNNVMYGTIQNVNAGDSITGIMYQGASNCDANGACDWDVRSFAQPENSGTDVICGNVNGNPACHVAMYDVSITLEAYGIVWCSDYPASSTTFAGLLVVSTNSINLGPSWGTTVNGDGCGESITDISSSGMTLNY